MRETTKWPPGPWRILARAGVYADGHGYVSIATPSTYGEHPINPKWSEATRHALVLQAAAPDEDAALLKAVEWGKRHGEKLAMAADLGVGEWEAFVPPWWHEAKAALAKARGEESTP